MVKEPANVRLIADPGIGFAKTPHQAPPCFNFDQWSNSGWSNAGRSNGRRSNGQWSKDRWSQTAGSQAAVARSEFRADARNRFD